MPGNDAVDDDTEDDGAVDPDTAAIDGRRTRWDAHRARRREEIVDAALAVLGDVGPEFGLDQVAVRAGVTKPVIYRHFDDRAALVDAVGERATNQLMERLMPALYDERALVPRIRATIDAFMRWLDESPNIYWIFARPPSGGAHDVERADREFIASALAGVLDEYLRARDVRIPETTEVWARGLVGFVQNTAEWWLEHRTMTRDEITEQLTMLVWAQMDGTARRHGVALDPDEPHPDRV